MPSAVGVDINSGRVRLRGFMVVRRWLVVVAERLAILIEPTGPVCFLAIVRVGGVEAVLAAVGVGGLARSSDVERGGRSSSRRRHHQLGWSMLMSIGSGV